MTLHTNQTGDEIKARLPNLPPYIVLPPHGGYSVFTEAYAEAVEASKKEHEALTS